MKEYSSLSKEELIELQKKLNAEYEDAKGKGLKLNMARGLPGAEQLDMEADFFNTLNPNSNFKSDAGIDCRNYGELLGIQEARKLMADMMSISPDNVIVFGNSSLNIMYDTVCRSMILGVCGSTPWCKLDKVKFLCPVPGYDRHFAITEQFGIEMINIPMNEDGPDMDFIEEYIRDESVKGVFCVPMYSNPSGITYSDETVKRFAALKPVAKDFRVIWDNAYCVHHIKDKKDRLLNIFAEAEKNGTEDFFIEVTSTSKISFPGAGVSALAASDSNIASIKKRMSVQTIGYDKINQLRHAGYFVNADGVDAHMKKHAAILRPKFEIVLNAFEKNLGGKGIAEWTDPNGGYFISLDVLPGCAKRTVELCKNAGVTLTGAGATFPYGKDPLDRNIRIAPTFPSVDELKKAVEILCVCVELSALEKLLNK
jgi:aspartate/methionine/tyrosine aminotransferase